MTVALSIVSLNYDWEYELIKIGNKKLIFIKIEAETIIAIYYSSKFMKQ